MPSTDANDDTPFVPLFCHCHSDATPAEPIYNHHGCVVHSTPKGDCPECGEQAWRRVHRLAVAAAPLVAELEDWPDFESDTLMVRVRLGAIRRLKEAL